MKTILIPIENHVSINTVMRCAVQLGQKFESYIEGVALGPDFTELAAADFSFSGMVFDEKTRRELFDEDLRTFESFMIAEGVKRQGEASRGPSFGWMGPRLMTDQGIGEYGRVFELIAVGKPENGVNTPRRVTFESALFESGRPVLIVPPKLPSVIGECIAIAWNGSSETARTVAFAMPLLCNARDVPVLYVPHSKLSGPNAEELTRNLRRHGISARTVLMGDDAVKAPGAALLEKADKLGADLLIKGGYAQSRLRDMFFGSVTSEILAKAQLPVFMAH
jgi:nucleotide-binding universal stress UspA family protein